MSSEGQHIRKENDITKNEKIYILLFTACAFIFIFFIIAVNILSDWSKVLANPYTEAWGFFFWILIYGFIIAILFFEKREIVVVLLSSFVALFWEVFAETFGWYFGLWNFAAPFEDPLLVAYLALLLGFEFYGFYFHIGMWYIFIYRSRFKFKYPAMISICAFFTVLGWLGDIFIAMFQTYVITFFVWTILNSLHLIGVISLYKLFKKR